MMPPRRPVPIATSPSPLPPTASSSTAPVSGNFYPETPQPRRPAPIPSIPEHRNSTGSVMSDEKEYGEVGTDEEDEDMRRAIQNSLADTPRQPPPGSWFSNVSLQGQQSLKGKASRTAQR